MSDAREDDSNQPLAEAKPADPAPPITTPPPPPAAKPATPTKPKNFRAAAWALSLLVLALALVGTAPYWAPPLLPLVPWGANHAAGTGDLAARLDAAEAARTDAEARLGRLEAQMQQQQGTQGTAPSDAAALQGVAQRLDALERRIGSISAPDTSALTQSVQQMGARVDELDAKLGRLATVEAAGDESDIRLLAALAELRAALAGSGPFAGELHSVLTLAPGDAAVAAALQPYSGAAAAGIPSAALLAERFRAETAPAILHTSQEAAPAGGDLGDRVLAKLRGLVTIRRIDAGSAGGAPSDAAATAVRAAEGALDTGDLAGALTALTGLSGAAADAAKPIVAAAQQRLGAEGAVAGLAQTVAARLAASPAPSPPPAPPASPAPQENH